MAEKHVYDVVVIGAGHNGLVCACYLAEAGLKVRVLERREVVGGAVVTEEFHPGFRNSVASYAVSLLNPKIICDLKLKDHGLRIRGRPLANFLPLPDDNYLKLPGELKDKRKEVARFSRRDADRLPAYEEMLGSVSTLVKDLMLETPPNIGCTVVDLLRGLKLGNRLRHLPMRARRDLLDLFTKSAGEVLDAWFEAEPIKAAFAFDSIVGTFASPYTPGTAYVLLHHALGEVNGKKGSWGHAVGGMGAITEAMAKEARQRGVEISTNVPVAKVRVSKGAVRGVALEDGTEIDARFVAANVNPKLLYLQLMEASDLDADFLKHMQNWKCESATFRMNVALSELPDFRCLPGKNCQEHHTAGIYFNPSLAYMEKAYADARALGWSSEPIIEMVIPSTLDDSLVDDTRAPRGAHVASLFCQHFRFALPNGRSWDQAREEAADLIVDTVDRYAPNFKASVIAPPMVLSPLDLERTFGLTGGDIFHGALTLDQLFSARPMLGYANYRGPVKGLYMCGSGTHPGGGVTGAPGHNAAREIKKDLRWSGLRGR
jgi:phytoene dehydrogenase-like protein